MRAGAAAAPPEPDAAGTRNRKQAAGADMGSNTAMDSSNPTHERLATLEVKASYAEDQLDAINQTLYRQQQQIDQLTREVLRLREQSTDAGSAAARGPRDELPPHY